MKATEAAALLTIAAAYDNRKPDADQARAWALVLDGLRFEDCRDAVVDHYRKSRDWLMPVEIITAVKRLRAKRIDAAGPLTPPPDLSPLATNAWLAEARRRIGDGEPVDVVAPPRAVTARDMNALSLAQSVDAELGVKPLHVGQAEARRRQQARQAGRETA